MTKIYDYALVSGGFDPVHVGHLRMFQDARELSHNVIVLLNNDEWLIKKKGKPFMSENQRKDILDEFKSVSEVIIQSSSDKSSSEAIKEFVQNNPNKPYVISQPMKTNVAQRNGWYQIAATVQADMNNDGHLDTIYYGSPPMPEGGMV